MKKYLTIVIVLFFIGAGASLTKLWVKSPESVRIFFGYASSSESVKPTLPRVIVRVVGFVKPTLPKVVAPTADRDKLISEARIKYMRNRRAKAKEFVAFMRGLNRPVSMVVNISTFGGHKDTGVTKKETGSIIKVKLRSIDVKSVRGMAWWMPEFSDENPNSPIKVPSVETWLGKGAKTEKGRISNANMALLNYDAEITSLDENGRIIEGPLRVTLYDRGPNTRFDKERADAFEKTWSDLGVLDATVDPNSDDHKVNLVVRLVPKEGYDITTEEMEFSSVSSEGIELPSWDSDEDKTTIASNP